MNNKYEAYQVVEKYSAKTLTEAVNTLITSGWEPFGSMTATPDDRMGGIRYMQPMVLPKDQICDPSKN